MLLAERMLRHGLFFDVPSKCVLINEPISVAKRILWSLNGEHHFVVGDVYIHLGVCRTRYKRSLMQRILSKHESSHRGNKNERQRSIPPIIHLGQIVQRVALRVTVLVVFS
jgi:hypothetical protein